VDLRDITVTWMDGREETYPQVSTQVRDGVLHIYQYASPRGVLEREWHHPLFNIRTWNPAGQDAP
jgi:hypothetical protein